MKKVKFNLTQPVKPNSESEEKVNEKLAIPVHSETELEKLECPFTKKLTECPFSQNNEKIKKVNFGLIKFYFETLIKLIIIKDGIKPRRK